MKVYPGLEEGSGWEMRKESARLWSDIRVLRASYESLADFSIMSRFTLKSPATMVKFVLYANLISFILELIELKSLALSFSFPDGLP